MPVSGVRATVQALSTHEDGFEDEAHSDSRTVVKSAGCAGRGECGSFELITPTSTAGGLGERLITCSGGSRGRSSGSSERLLAHDRLDTARHHGSSQDTRLVSAHATERTAADKARCIFCKIVKGQYGAIGALQRN